MVAVPVVSFVGHEAQRLSAEDGAAVVDELLHAGAEVLGHSLSAEQRLHVVRLSVRQAEAMCKRMSAATGIHVGQFGIMSDNPSSADAIYLENSPLILKCKSFIKEAKAALSRVAVAAVATELGIGYAEAEEACDVSVNFLNPAMPTLAQQADSSIKLASVVDGFAGTPTFWRLNGLDDDEVRNVVSEIRRNVTKAAAFDLMAGVRQASDAAASDD